MLAKFATYPHLSQYNKYDLNLYNIILIRGLKIHPSGEFQTDTFQKYMAPIETCINGNTYRVIIEIIIGCLSIISRDSAKRWVFARELMHRCTSVDRTLISKHLSKYLLIKVIVWEFSPSPYNIIDVIFSQIRASELLIRNIGCTECALSRFIAFHARYT